MKAQFVYENMRFERGLDPKEAMNIGEIALLEKRFISKFKDLLPEKCPISHTVHDGISIPESDSDVYYEVGRTIGSFSEGENELIDYYDSLPSPDQDDLNDKLISIFAEKYNLEW